MVVRREQSEVSTEPGHGLKLRPCSYERKGWGLTEAGGEDHPHPRLSEIISNWLTRN